MALRTNETLFAISTRKEGTYNTASTDVADYTVMTEIDTPTISLPTMVKLDNTGQAGLRYKSYTENDYWDYTQVAISGRLNNSWMGRLGARAFGGTITTSTLTSPAYKHVVLQRTKSQGYQLNGTSFCYNNGDFDSLYAGMVVNTFEITWENGAAPRFAAGLIGTGKHTTPSAITLVAPNASSTPPMPWTVQLNWTKDASTTDLFSSSCVVKSGRLFLNNNIDTSDDNKCQGDSSVGPSGGTAKYVRSLPMQTPVVGAELVIEFEDDTYWIDYATNEEIGLQVKFLGNTITGLHKEAVIWDIPSASITANQQADRNGKLVYNLGLTPYASGSGSIAAGQAAAFTIQNQTASNYD